MAVQAEGKEIQERSVARVRDWLGRKCNCVQLLSFKFVLAVTQSDVADCLNDELLPQDQCVS